MANNQIILVIKTEISNHSFAFNNRKLFPLSAVTATPLFVRFPSLSQWIVWQRRHGNFNINLM